MRNPIIPIRPQYIHLPGESELDYRAICCFVAAGFFLDNDTYYQNQKVLRPASEYHNGEENTYFQWHHEPRDISFHQAVDEFAHLFETITQEQTFGKRIILPLSGGLDSRSQAAALKGQANVFAYSYEFAGSFNETKYGQAIAKKMHWPFNGFQIPESYLWGRIDELAQINGCYSEFTAPRQMAVIHEFYEKGDCFYLGHWGDVLFDDMGVPDYLGFDQQVAVLYKKILKKGGFELAELLWRAWGLSGDFGQYLKDRLSQLLAKIPIENANARIRAFKSLYWAPRWTSINLSVFEHVHPLALPYYDDRMCEFVCRIPERYLAGRKIQIEYIKRKAPELASIPWQTYDPCNLYNYNQYDSLHVLAQRLIRKLSDYLQKQLQQREVVLRNWEIQFDGALNDVRLREYIFENKDFERLVPREVVLEIYDNFKKVDKVYWAHPLSMLLTLSLFTMKYK